MFSCLAPCWSVAIFPITPPLYVSRRIIFNHGCFQQMIWQYKYLLLHYISLSWCSFMLMKTELSNLKKRNRGLRRGRRGLCLPWWSSEVCLWSQWRSAPPSPGWWSSRTTTSWPVCRVRSTLLNWKLLFCFTTVGGNYLKEQPKTKKASFYSDKLQGLQTKFRNKTIKC